MSSSADKPVRHILVLSGGNAASCVHALDMLGPILTRHTRSRLLVDHSGLSRTGTRPPSRPKGVRIDGELRG